MPGASDPAPVFLPDQPAELGLLTAAGYPRPPASRISCPITAVLETYGATNLGRAAEGGGGAMMVSYTSADRPWAEWIAWELEHAGFRTIAHAWDILPGATPT